ncbi:GNAT family N-acetyltransferase [Streptomyces buecherae]|uniref:GNAT family N-acetyltransferase n=1 Tax=Streptomyces buecherae TaxID=2763006 RepID=UPI0036C50F69
MDPLESPHHARHPRPTTPVTGELAVTTASMDDWLQVARWAAEEGWNPGRGDAPIFHAVDPAGFFIGRLGGRPVTAVSIVNYSPQYAFLGFYLVHPDHRGRGLGLATWRAAFPHAGDRTVGLDAVPAQQAAYQRAGFAPAHQTTRYGGIPTSTTPADPPTITPVTDGHLNSLATYDQQCFPADRSTFLAHWLTAPGHVAYAAVRDGEITGYGVIRPAQDGRRIGPLFADTPEDADALFNTLITHLSPGEEVHLDIPEPHKGALSLAGAHGLAPRSHTIRMYTGPVPPTHEDRTYAVTTLELG